MMAGDKKSSIQVRGHISRPVFGEGRQAPDRQMLFVNSRPCALPQITKAINEVYKSFNVAQSPFVFADFHMDTNAYDVNVSPDKRTILLHDAGALIESLKQSLQKLFESADQTVPQSQILGKLPLARQRSLPETTMSDRAMEQEVSDRDEGEGGSRPNPRDRMKGLLGNIRTRDTQPNETLPRRTLSQQHFSPAPVQELQDTADDRISDDELFVSQNPSQAGTELQDEQHDAPASHSRKPIPDFETPNAVQNAFDRMRPRRLPAEMATITTHPARKRRIHTPSRPSIFGRMQDFAAPGSQVSTHDSDEQESIEDEDEGEDEVEEVEEENDGVHEDLEAEAGKETECEVEGQAEEEVEDAESFVPSDYNATQPNEHIQTEPQPAEEDMNAEEKKKREDAEVQRLIEEAGKANQANSISRANKLHKGVSYRDSTVHLTTTINAYLSRIESQANYIHDSHSRRNFSSSEEELDESRLSQVAPEERLTLTVNKDDFARMRIHGQFNLGFILASRSTSTSQRAESDPASGLMFKDELFIIDQHASDEKINFERLQSTTTVQNQRLVHPKRLNLTAVEEEIVIENQVILEKNGFVVDVDDSGDRPIGQRCSLLSLPLSKEVVFDVRDLEELIAILSETSTSNITDPGIDIPRPSKVRKMFAMRACRSSIMIGKTLTQRQMERVVRDMGTIDKPWNCPHGRPTMRHLFSLGRWGLWDEYADIHTAGREDGDLLEPVDDLNAWREYVRDAAEE
ncbi:ATP-binding mismatch repair protein PMS1 [Aspergillus foveolatus]|uniref:ATP-binding mismatch repair protein PMS1 n=1 Tax=Aspergillus foveolatus TaxID=210207 RepID=UPI003CCC9EB9